MKFRTVLRIIVGGLFFGHGAHKLFGWFGGRGLDATAQGFESMGMHPGRANALAAGVSEAGGGAALALGLASPLAESALIATMLTAIHRVHLKNGVWATTGGYEYNLVLIVALLTLAETVLARCRWTTPSGGSGPAWAGRWPRWRPVAPVPTVPTGSPRRTLRHRSQRHPPRRRRTVIRLR